MAKGNFDDPFYYDISTNDIAVHQAQGYSWSTVVTEIFGSTGTNIINPDNRLKVELPSGASGLTDTELRASSVPIEQVSGSIWSTNVLTMPSVTVTATDLDIRDLTNATDSVRVYQLSGATWSTEATQSGTWNIGTVTTVTNSIGVSLLNGAGATLDPRDRNWTITETVPVSAGSTLDVKQVSGANWSVSVIDIFGSVATSVVNPDGRLKVELPTGSSGLTDSELRASSIDVQQASGASWSTNVLTMPAVVVTSITNTIATANIDSSGVQYSGSNPFPYTIVTNATATMNVALTDSGGVQYSGSNPVPVLIVPNTTSSTYVVGALAHDAADDGANPVKVGGVGKTTNPTAVADGDVVRFIADDIGRQVMTVHQVRDLIATARAAPTNVAPTTLLAGGGAGVFHDLISITASNASTAANTAVGAYITFDVLDCQTGGPVLTFTVTNGDTITYQPPAPLRQSEAGSTWQIDITSDASTLAAAPLVVTALFAKNV